MEITRPLKITQPMKKCFLIYPTIVDAFFLGWLRVLTLQAQYSKRFIAATVTFLCFLHSLSKNISSIIQSLISRLSLVRLSQISSDFLWLPLPFSCIWSWPPPRPNNESSKSLNIEYILILASFCPE